MSIAVSGDYSSYLATYYYQEARNTFHETQTQARSSSDNRHTFARKPILTKGLSASVSHHGSKGHFLVNSSCPASMPNIYSLAPPSPDVGNSQLNAFLKPYGVSVTGMGDQCKGILWNVTMSLTSHNAMKFENIDEQQFTIISHFIHHNEWLFGQPCLSYLSRHVLFVEWPTAIHEVPITFLTSTLNKTIVDLPYPKHLLNLVLKVAFTQTLVDILLKVGELLNAFPEILMVIVIDIMETRVYQAPATGSVAWNTFRQHKDPLGLGKSIPPQHSQKGMVINSGGHTWCSINSIDYHIWVKNGLNGGKIDVDVTDDEWYAYSTLPSSWGMDGVDRGGINAMLNKGFKLIKESLIAFCKEISGDKDIDLKALEGTLVKFKPQWG
ncbi:hypothetical protein SCLCIDRAFT_22253 [Scleroderma citrinum Foug A]|uniref:Uncharacterized protein n=1 Tax=Scleroderma citrinum Foug A TaxID=1036808 RepID=A0A0C3AM61_9AGAM|nr:hypothetical protein SCLCIDRAFT_22253 [Scleroderma citrinum Foug A]